MIKMLTFVLPTKKRLEVSFHSEHFF